MKKSEIEKSLIRVNQNSIFLKIKRFLNNFFKKENHVIDFVDNKPKEDIKKKQFVENIRNIDDEETKLLKLQKQYRNGEIKEEELTQTQIKLLCDLYDKQIENLQKSNKFRKQRILQYRKKL